jgi:peroxiredoxin
MSKSFPILPLFLAGFLLLSSGVHAQTVVQDFTLKNVDGTNVSLSGYKLKKAVVVIFTGNHCVYSKKYESRVMNLAGKYESLGVQFLLINSNNPELSEDDNFDGMKLRAMEQGYTFPYLADEDQAVAKMMGAEKNPHAFVLAPIADGFSVVYSGLIDDNPLMEDAVNNHYLAAALDQVLNGSIGAQLPTPVQGCGIKGLEE